MNFHELGEAGHHKIPFICKAIAPAAVIHLRMESRGHYLHYTLGFRIAVEIEITAQIGPMIQRFDHGDRASALLQGIANFTQKSQRMLNS